MLQECDAGLYSEFDAEGIPTKNANSEELSAKKRKDLVKDGRGRASSLFPECRV